MPLIIIVLQHIKFLHILHYCDAFITLQCVQDAIERELEKFKTANPNLRVALITFGDEVIVIPFINPRRACAASVAVLGLCVCVSDIL